MDDENKAERKRGPLEELLRLNLVRDKFDPDSFRKVNPGELAYLYVTGAFCQGWDVSKGDKLLIGKIMECGICQACSSRRVFPDFASFSEEDFRKACADAVRKVLDMYYYRAVPA